MNVLRMLRRIQLRLKILGTHKEFQSSLIGGLILSICMQLINVIIVNSHGVRFIYSDDLSEVVKTGVEISKFLLEVIKTVRPDQVTCFK